MLVPFTDLVDFEIFHRPREIFAGGIAGSSSKRKGKKKMPAPFLLARKARQTAARAGGQLFSAGITEVEYGVVYSRV